MVVDVLFFRDPFSGGRKRIRNTGPFIVAMDRVVPDIRPFFYIRYAAGYPVLFAGYPAKSESGTTLVMDHLTISVSTNLMNGDLSWAREIFCGTGVYIFHFDPSPMQWGEGQKYELLVGWGKNMMIY